MVDLEPHQSREMLIDNLAIQIPKKPQFFKHSDQKYFFALEGMEGAKRREKYRKRESMLVKASPYDRKLWSLVLTASIAQAADVAKNIGAARPDFLALMLTGSNRVGLGDLHDPELDFRLITEDEPWDVIDMFKIEYGARSRAKDLRNWRERLSVKLGTPTFEPSNYKTLEPLSAADLVLPADILDVGWNPQNESLAPLLSEGGAYTRKALNNFVLVPDRMKTIIGRRDFSRSMMPIIETHAKLAENQLAFSTPIWIKKGEKNYVNGLITKARQMVIPASIAV